jgi:hypothetical protein
MPLESVRVQEDRVDKEAAENSKEKKRDTSQPGGERPVGA